MRDPIADLVDALSVGPRNFYDLEDHLTDLGHDLGEDPDAVMEALIEGSGRFIELEEAVVIDPLSLFDGVTFTVDFSESHDLLDHRPDLLFVETVSELQLELLIDGEATGLRTYDKGYRLHHPRWLHLTEEGRLTGFKIQGGTLDVLTRVEPVPDSESSAALVRAFQRLGEAMAESGLPMELEPVLFELAAAGDRRLFSGVMPPVTHLLEVAGLEHENMLIVPAGFDWDAWLSAQAEEFEA
ncbi:MAG: hypothetical protein OEW30_00770 [Acidimicrobiia bacterium]|nr:hypothetical protein [Acidimicrobiia bacterium]